MVFSGLLRKLMARNHGNISYSQSGEDVIARFLFQSLRIVRPTYIDVGAHDPFYLNNTAIFYADGSRGINIEPNKMLLDSFKKHRPHDVNLCMCVGKYEGVIDYYLMDIPTLNTASKEEAMRLEASTDRRIVDVVQVPVKTIASVIDEYCSGVFPDFLTLDVEGVDEVILESIEFGKQAPKVICVETLTYTEHSEPQKKDGILRLLTERGYSIYADTYINTLFVRTDIWRRASAGDAHGGSGCC